MSSTVAISTTNAPSDSARSRPSSVRARTVATLARDSLAARLMRSIAPASAVAEWAMVRALVALCSVSAAVAIACSSVVPASPAIAAAVSRSAGPADTN
ncbi:hypothetical protein D9M73_205150 [compost metagenome]